MSLAYISCAIILCNILQMEKKVITFNILRFIQRFTINEKIEDDEILRVRFVLSENDDLKI